MKSLLFGLIFLVTPAFASNLAETYHLSPVMPSGKYQGQKLNVKMKRAIAILNGSPYHHALEREAEHWLIANIYHNKKFYIAAVPKRVKQVLFLTEPFMGVLAHSMLRFHFDQPVRLLAEVPSLQEVAEGVVYKPLTEPVELKDLLMSVEATSPDGINEFSAVESFFNTRGLVFRFMSLTGLGVSRLQNGEATIYQHPLNMSEREASRTLRQAFYTSDNLGMSQMYNTLFANCNKYCAGILDRSLKMALRKPTYSKKFIASVQALAANFMVFAKFNPPVMNVLASNETINMENEPEFQRLAALYPRAVLCEEALTPVAAQIP